MEKITQIIDFIWILYHTILITVKKIFFTPKKTPDIYIADEQGFFYNQSDIRYVPVKVLWDLYKISRIFNLTIKDNFVSLYIRGGAAVGNFNAKISDLDLIVFLKKPSTASPTLLYIRDNLTNIFPRYSKIDILYLDINDHETNKIDPKVKTILNMQPAYVFGKRIKFENKIKFNNSDLWSFFSSSISEKNQKQYFINEITSIESVNLKSQKIIIQQITKCLIRALFEQLTPNKKIYTKNILHIKKIIEKNEIQNEKIQDILNLICLFENFVSKEQGSKELKSLLLKTINYF